MRLYQGSHPPPASSPLRFTPANPPPMSESAVLLLRNPGSYAYGTSDSSQLALQKAEGAFTSMSLEERSKFREETLSNVKGITRRGLLLYLSNGAHPDSTLTDRAGG
jgi:uncharacterized membrane protein